MRAKINAFIMQILVGVAITNGHSPIAVLLDWVEMVIGNMMVGPVLKKYGSTVMTTVMPIASIGVVAAPKTLA